MKTESTVKFVLRLAATLLLITAVVAAALAAVNSVTAPVIAQLKADKVQAAIEEVLPGGGQAVAFTDNTGWVSNVYKSDKGFAVEVTPTTGFNGAITMMVGIDTEGKILGISVVSQTETAGLGAVCAAKTEAGQNVRGDFVGLSGEVLVNKDGGDVDAITGATITSRAICDGVNAALACVAKLG